jgi:predicted deacylase
MIDAHLHGNEYYGYEVLYSLANWLLTSNDATAKSILSNNYVVMVPCVNYRWGRTNYNVPSWMTTKDYGDGDTCGVNLNRNFSPSWSSSLSQSNTDAYSGISADSESEAKALITAWNKFHPRVYWNLHQGAGPSTTCRIKGSQSSTDANAIKALLPSIQSNLGVGTKWSFSPSSGMGSGYSIDGAANLGAAGFMTELLPEWSNGATTKADLNSGDTFKNAKSLFIAMCQSID